MKQAVDALLVAKLVDKSVQDAAAAIATEVINDLGENPFNFYYFNIFPKNIANVTIVKKAYKNLRLLGSESFVEMYIKIDRLTKRQLKVFKQQHKNWTNGRYPYTTRPPKSQWSPPLHISKRIFFLLIVI